MVAQREKFSSQAVAGACWLRMRKIARNDGRHFQAVLEDALRDYIEGREQQRVRPEVMAHYRASVERNRLLAELLAQ